MSFATAIATLLGGYGQGRQQALQRRDSQQQFQQQQTLEQQRLAGESAYQTGELDIDRQRLAQERAIHDADLAAQGIDPKTGKPYPTPQGLGIPLPPNADYNAASSWAAQMYIKALALPDDTPGKAAIVQRFKDAATALPRGYQETTGANLNTARVDLVKAQASWWKQRHSEFEQQLAQHMQIANAQQRVAMQRARNYGRSRAPAGSSEDMRETLGIMTALNAANGKSDQEAFQEGMAQFKAADATWRQQAKMYQAGFGNDPGSEPQASTYITNVAAPPPATVINTTITLPDGRQVTVPTVRRGVGGGGGNQGGDLSAKISAARKGGYSDAAIRAGLLKRGYTDQQLNAAGLGTGQSGAFAGARSSVTGGP